MPQVTRVLGSQGKVLKVLERKFGIEHEAAAYLRREGKIMLGLDDAGHCLYVELNLVDL